MQCDMGEKIQGSQRQRQSVYESNQKVAGLTKHGFTCSASAKCRGNHKKTS